MIISLRGTSGAGKSHLVRRIVKNYVSPYDVYTEGRSKPVYSIYDEKVAVLGHYMIANGGVDTLSDISYAYALAVDLAKRYHVLMEGKNMSDGLKNITKLTLTHEVHIVHITTPISKCISSVHERGHNIAEKSIIKTDAKIRRNVQVFIEQKMNVFQGDRDECYKYVMNLLCR